MKSLLAVLGALSLAACGADDNAAKEAEAPPPPACENATFEGVALTHCTADPKYHRITMVLGPKGGGPYRSLSQLAVERANRNPPVAFATNGGMFDDGGYPIGYYVENGERLHKLNRAEGWGNFHMLPNGVFYGEDGKWAVRTAEEFADKVDSRPDFGTQSGPMLLISGKLHPRIDENGQSLKLRNAVGVDRQGRAHFVISDAPISFGKLARYFRDKLETPNALFLDGSVSSLWNPEIGRIDGGPPLGPLIVVEKRAKAPIKQAVKDAGAKD